MSDHELDKIVNYIKSLPAAPTTQATVVALPEQIDLICDMTVQPTQSTPQVTFDGETYYFCSEFCAERFKRSPKKWIPASTSSATGPSTLPTGQP